MSKNKAVYWSAYAILFLGIMFGPLANDWWVRRGHHDMTIGVIFWVALILLGYIENRIEQLQAALTQTIQIKGLTQELRAAINKSRIMRGEPL